MQRSEGGGGLFTGRDLRAFRSPVSLLVAECFLAAAYDVPTGRVPPRADASVLGLPGAGSSQVFDGGDGGDAASGIRGSPQGRRSRAMVVPDGSRPVLWYTGPPLKGDPVMNLVDLLRPARPASSSPKRKKLLGRATTRQLSAVTAVTAVVGGLLIATGAPGVSAVAAKPPADTGFEVPFSGSEKYEYLAPTEFTNADQINEPLGPKRADKIAKKLGLNKKKVLTPLQYELFITGQGIGGDPDAAKLADESVRIFTNTTGNPLYDDSVLASYGLFVKDDNGVGILMSLANEDAPTRIANTLLVKGGYIDTWFRANGATDSLIQLYESGYTISAYYGDMAQQQSGEPQLIKTTKGDETAPVYVGMSMGPALWLTNFALLYTLSPEKAANMPGYWAPIPDTTASAVLESPTGQVPWVEYKSDFG